MKKITLAVIASVFMMTTFSVMAWPHGHHSQGCSFSHHHSEACYYN